MKSDKPTTQKRPNRQRKSRQGMWKMLLLATLPMLVWIQALFGARIIAEYASGVSEISFNKEPTCQSQTQRTQTARKSGHWCKSTFQRLWQGDQLVCGSFWPQARTRGLGEVMAAQQSWQGTQLDLQHAYAGLFEPRARNWRSSRPPLFLPTKLACVSVYPRIGGVGSEHF